MQETTSTDNNNNLLNNNSYQKFLFIEKISGFKNIDRLKGVELCVIESDFSKSDLKEIKKLNAAHKNIEFWISSNSATRENILAACEIGIKNVVPSPIEGKIIREYFNKQKLPSIPSNNDENIDYSSVAGLKVMIVDDNSMNVELLEEVLSKFDLKITSFLKASDACKVILHEKFDLFLLDIMMPEVSGFDLAKKIKETPHNKTAPIIFISALSDSNNKITGYNLGSCAYIEKPFDINIIKSQIYNVLKNQKAQEILASDQDNFFAMVAHDLKTPISAEINALQLLLDNNFGALEENQQEILEDILNSTRFMQDMVENLLSKNKIDYGQINLSKQVYSLKDLTQHCIELTKYILSDKKQTVNFKCSLENTLLPLDFTEMKRAIHNLIANASAYSPSGKEIIVEVFQHDGYIGVSVQDFGKGIALENQKDIFLQYMTLAKQNKTVGSGLGLYITKRIVEAHCGEILLESKVGYGTKISILLPIYTKV